MKRILLQYHIWEREYIILDILKQQLVERGTVVEYGDYMDINRCLDFHPDIIVTHPVRTRTDATILSIIKLVTGAVLIPMTVEGYYDLDDSREVLQTIGLETCPINLIDYFIMWGEKTKIREGEQLLRLHKISSIDKIRVFGYIPYEKEKVLVYAKTNQYYYNYVQWKKKYSRVISCVTGFPESTMKNVFMEDMIVEDKDSEQYKREVHYYEKYLAFCREYRDKYVNNIIRLAVSHLDIGIVVKLHPTEIKQLKNEGVEYYNKLKEIDNIFLVDREFPMGVFLEEVEALVHYSSTVSLEAYIYKVPSLLVSADVIDNKRASIGNTKFAPYTETVHIDDYEKFEALLLNGIGFRDDQRIEGMLLDAFNWRRTSKYCPSEGMAEFLAGDLHTTELQASDLLDEGFVSADDLQGIRTQIYKRTLLSLLKLDIKNVKYYIRCNRRLISGISDIQSDIERFIEKRLNPKK